MRILTKSFEDLSLTELYQLLQLRSEVFVVEQECAYQDVDGMDQEALHVMGFEGEVMLAYTRVFPPGVYDDYARIGRVVVRKTVRSKGLGVDIMKATMEAVKAKYNTSKMSLSAQTYLVKFYRDMGFHETGNEYLEDGIPHILMVKD
ncbi:MAG: GNAT family N-acetyltransferase [Eudoraea sp.]|nr:GNAT family N-acetyltransferase [Eudoraea sp.]MBT8322244.1 GNAT family N-acetyltransferase [Eudoraea sp.]NNJ40366.1 GNAT family N-acetyltransferase [Eudoraea sp.]